VPAPQTCESRRGPSARNAPDANPGVRRNASTSASPSKPGRSQSPSTVDVFTPRRRAQVSRRLRQASRLTPPEPTHPRLHLAPHEPSGPPAGRWSSRRARGRAIAQPAERGLGVLHRQVPDHDRATPPSTVQRQRLVADSPRLAQAPHRRRDSENDVRFAAPPSRAASRSTTCSREPRPRQKPRPVRADRRRRSRGELSTQEAHALAGSDIYSGPQLQDQCSEDSLWQMLAKACESSRPAVAIFQGGTASRTYCRVRTRPRSRLRSHRSPRQCSGPRLLRALARRSGRVVPAARGVPEQA